MPKILVIDDSDEQLELAKQAGERKGWEVVVENPTNTNLPSSADVTWPNLIEDADGVVTDLLWRHEGQEKPSGLLVVIHATLFQRPVVICTNGGDYCGGHHGEAIGFINDGYRTTVRSQCPFGWEEHKDWDRAMELLNQRMKK